MRRTRWVAWILTAAAAWALPRGTADAALLHYWNFDQASGNFSNLVDATQYATPGAGMVRVSGLIGSGAMSLTNHSSCYAASALNTGFSVTDGITVEALVRWMPAAGWSASGDNDHIVRKEESAKRILLAFQPNGAGADTLAWGINVGGSYAELDMPIDGASGRPSFTQATNGTHHVVATYDKASGLKAVYWDGVLVYSNLYTAGSAIDTSGAGNPFTIGNTTPNNTEPFNGTLDEVTVWNHALPAAEIAARYANIQSSTNYFALAAPVAAAATNITMTGFNANWGSLVLATNYRLDVASDAAFGSLLVGYDNLSVGTATTYPVSGLNPGTYYYYRIRAEGVLAASGNSSTVRVSTAYFDQYPMHYWNFDQASGNYPDMTDGSHPATPGPGIFRTNGLAGSGAIYLNNANNCYVSAGTTGYAVTNGITIEALVQWTPAAGWSASGDYDTIVRKAEGPKLFLLAFQPNGAGQDTLAWGLNVGGSYAELDMPMDGASGRPSFSQMTNGIHHVVASYDKASGLKAIYWDGTLVYSTTYSAGSAVDTSGTSQQFTIGNVNANNTEAFNGTIDEVAFYSRALSADEVANHWAGVQSGNSYYDAMWDGGGTAARWSVADNWVAIGPPTNNNVFFAGSTKLACTNDLNEGTEFAGITFNSGAGAFLLSGNALNLKGDVRNLSANTQTIGLGLELSAVRTFAASNGNIAVTGPISGGGGVTKAGNNLLSLTGTNTYTGVTTVSAGTLVAGSLANVNTSSAIGKGSAAGSSADLVLNGGALRYEGSEAQSANRLFSVGTSGGTLDASGSGSGTLSLTGTGAMGFNSQSGARALTLTGSNAGNNTLACVIGDSGGATALTKSGSGLWVLSGANTYSGATTVSGGVLCVTGGSALPDAGAVTFSDAAGAELRLLSSETMGALSGGGASGGNVNLNGNVLTVANTATVTFSGAITNTGTMVKTGSGSLTLGGNNTFVGSVYVSNGTLAVDGRLTNGPISVSGPATLGGTGEVGAVTSSGILSPRGSGVGRLGMTALTLSGGVYQWTITNASGGADADWDLLVVSNALGQIDMSAAGVGAITIRVECAAAGLPNLDYGIGGSWKIADAGSVLGFAGSKFTVDDGAFTPGSEGGSWFVTNSAGDLFVSFAPPAPVDLAVSAADAPDPAPVGDAITYTITVTNPSAYLVNTYHVTNRLAPGMIYMSSSDSGSHGGGVVSWTLGNLAPNGSKTLTLTANSTVQGSISVVSEVWPLRAELDASNNRTTNTTTVYCPNAGVVPNTAPAARTATNGQSLSFAVVATNNDCNAPMLNAAGLPSGSTFAVTTNGYGVTGLFSWPFPATGTYPVRFYSYNETKATSSVVTVIYVGNGEANDPQGVPLTQTNWHVVITNLMVTSSGNATVVWTAVDGVTYDLYSSTLPIGGGASWGKLVDGQEAYGVQATASVSSADSGGMRFYQVVPQGAARTDRGVWGVVRPAIPAGFSMFAPPLESDLKFNGALGTNLAAVLPPQTYIYLLNPGGDSWKTLYRHATNLEWIDQDTGQPYAVPLDPGQGFFISNPGGNAVPVFTGQVGNDGASQNTLKTDFNIIGLSEGKGFTAGTAFSASTMSPPPEGSYNDEMADQVVLLDSSGTWRRLIRRPTGIWYDTVTRGSSSLILMPGQAYYYIRRNSDSTVSF
jgi:uncharacterized repeat protein (TIGR01451 family)